LHGLGAVPGSLGGLLGRLGAILEPSWPVLEASWAILEASWGLLDVSWCFLTHLEGILEASWGSIIHGNRWTGPRWRVSRAPSLGIFRTLNRNFPERNKDYDFIRVSDSVRHAQAQGWRGGSSARQRRVLATVRASKQGGSGGKIHQK